MSSSISTALGELVSWCKKFSAHEPIVVTNYSQDPETESKFFIFLRVGQIELVDYGQGSYHERGVVTQRLARKMLEQLESSLLRR